VNRQLQTENWKLETDHPQRRSLPQRLLIVTSGLLLLLVASMVAAAGVGAVHIPPGELLRSVLNRIRGGAVTDSVADQILWTIRLPRIALGAIVGGALSIAGGSMQGLLLNPLADPYLIGVSAGAAVGATVAILLHFADFAGGLGRTLAGFVAALVTLAIVYRLSLRRGRIGREAFILAGVVVGSFMWALVTLVMALASGRQLTEVVSWLLGNLGMASQWSSVGIAAALTVLASLILYAFGRDLNLLSLGDESAKQMGVEVERLKRTVILLAALLTTAAVAFSGIIGFVGLIMPHVARRLWGPDHRLLLPASALLGAIYLVWADTLARVVLAPSELPVGVITSLLGAPFFCYLLVTARRSEE
jgi:iron complex transport system permease protein